MFGFLFKKIFGSTNDRYLRKLRPLVQRINELEPEMQQLEDADFPIRIAQYRQEVQDGVRDLDALLPEVFALVREASLRKLGMRHYDVQLIGGMVLHKGKIAEMKTGEGKTFQTKAEVDPVLDREYIDRMTKAYAPDRDLTDPYISPLFGNFHGFPPVYIQVGENEILLDDSLRLYKNLIKAGVAAHIDRFPGMWHVFQMSPFKKASEAMDKNAEFIYSVCR